MKEIHHLGTIILNKDLLTFCNTPFREVGKENISGSLNKTNCIKCLKALIKKIEFSDLHENARNRIKEIKEARKDIAYAEKYLFPEIE